MVKKEDAIKFEIVKCNRTRNGKLFTDSNKIYIFKCKTCEHFLRIQSGHLKKATGYCIACLMKGRPFEALYNIFVKNVKDKNKRLIDLTYEQFLEFTKINNCHYCNIIIKWYPYTRKDKLICRDGLNYQLDRKNNNIGYTYNNLVVCCKNCNYAKSDRYSYEDWFGMTEFLRRKNGI